MAAGVPQEKATQFLELYGNMLLEGIAIDEFSYRRGVRELERQNTSLSVSALGFLHGLYGDIDRAVAVFEAADPVRDVTVAINFCFMLRHTGSINRLYHHAYELAEVHQTKALTASAYSIAYRFGDRERLEHYFDMHIKLLSEDEHRADAEVHKQELLSEIDSAYRLSGCSRDQFELLAKMIWTLTERHRLTPGTVELSSGSSISYVIDIPNQNADFLASLNWELAEAICSQDALDDCKIVARFSPPRQLHVGVSYGNN
ncbi:hypothetical protein [Kluyvera sichuanensis]|uniref:hypothetical protein n=1 Tax=Kluyvera sichuanensis TaxID=2725494 RepID=UPI0034A291ED